MDRSFPSLDTADFQIRPIFHRLGRWVRTHIGLLIRWRSGLPDQTNSTHLDSYKHPTVEIRTQAKSQVTLVAQRALAECSRRASKRGEEISQGFEERRFPLSAHVVSGAVDMHDLAAPQHRGDILVLLSGFVTTQAPF